MVLDDDSYRMLQVGEPPMEGDIALYWEQGEVDHVGVIVDFKDPIAMGGNQIPVVMSKWGFGPEYVHVIGSTPYGDAIEIWTDRD
jgi:hypothetical protein